MTEAPFKLVEDRQALDDAVSTLMDAEVLGVDTETTGFDPYRSRVRLLQVSTPEGNFVFDLFRHPALDDPRLRDIFATERVVKIFHHAKFDMKMLLHLHGIEVRGVFDTMLASRLIDAGSGQGSHGLSAVCERYLGQPLDKTLQASDWAGALTTEQYKYAAKDSEVLIPLRGRLIHELEVSGQEEVARLEFECVLAIAAMELAGMAIDVECWKRQAEVVERAHAIISAQLKRELATGVQQLTLFGEPDINLDSPAQVIDALAGMGIIVEGTRSWQLQPLAKEHHVVAKLLEYRGVQKAVTSYGAGLLEHVHPITGRLHPDFRQIGAAGGRMSCSDPNLQQVPSTPEYRTCFHAPAGRRLIVADYSQIELRILADWSQDTALVEALVSGKDLHCATASQMFAVPLEAIGKTERNAAKQLNYGLMYGLGATGLAARLECSVESAEEMIRKYFTAYAGVAEWLRDAAYRAVRGRATRTRSGRLIRFEFNPEERSEVAAIQRAGKNAPIQGSSADILKRALTLLHDALKPLEARIVNCVHDEIVVEALEADSKEAASVVEQKMLEAGREFVSRVPLSVDVHVGEAWLK